MITLYDFDGKVKGAPWNPNVWKTRYSLSFKQLPYKTIWIEYPDVEDVCKKIGASSTMLKPDGSPMYTLPAIYDDATGVALADSASIAEYLDKTYPDTPALFPLGTHALQLALIELLSSKLTPLWIYVVPEIPKSSLNPRSLEHVEKARSADFGVPALSYLRPANDELKAEMWQKVIEAFRPFHECMKEDSTWLMGDVVSFADFAVGSAVYAIYTTFGSDSAEWKEITICHGGRWGRLIENLKQYREAIV